MLTGRHLVRDVMCMVCDAKLGWMYEFAMDEAQRYKEGKVILEKALVREVDGSPEPSVPPINPTTTSSITNNSSTYFSTSNIHSGSSSSGVGGGVFPMTSHVRRV